MDAHDTDDQVTPSGSKRAKRGVTEVADRERAGTVGTASKAGGSKTKGYREAQAKLLAEGPRWKLMGDMRCGECVQARIDFCMAYGGFTPVR